jgi:hypothetical protein
MHILLALLTVFQSLFFDPLPVAKEAWQKRHLLNVNPQAGTPEEIEDLQQKIRRFVGLVTIPEENYVFKQSFLDQVRYSFLYFPARASQGSNKFQENHLSPVEQEAMVALAKISKDRDPTSLVTFNLPSPNGSDLLVGEKGEWVVKKGLCSAVSLTFASKLLEQLNNDLISHSPEEFIVAAATATTFVKNGENQDLAILQGVMNTISRRKNTIDPLSPAFLHEKASALAAFVDLKATPAGMPMIKPALVPTGQLDIYLNNLKTGVYFFRSVVEEKNSKGEEMGHSQIYVKTPEVSLYFDPNIGTVIFQPEDNVASFVHYLWNFYLPATGLNTHTIGQFYSLTLDN